MRTRHLRNVAWAMILGVLILLCGLIVVVLRPRPRAPRQDLSGIERQRTNLEVAEVIFDGGFAAGWEDWGWGPHEIADGGPARIQFAGYGGIILRHGDLPSRFGALSFQFKAPPGFDSFLEVSLGSKQADKSLLPHVAIERQFVAPLDNGFSEALVPWSLLNPIHSPFDRIVIQARRVVSADWVLVDKVLLTKAEISDASAPPPVRKVKLSIDCGKPATPISPLIYGISQGSGDTGETAHRIGGNPMTRLNWELGAWNTGSDWYFENVKGPKGLWEWIDDTYNDKIKLALVVPMIGWVAKDAVSVGFPISKVGPQRGHDPERSEAGDGAKPDGTPIKPGPPTATSVAAPPELIGRWVEMLRAKDRARGGRGVAMYILDNEPNLWHGTHRDVHPEPLTYDELIDRTIRYGTAIRQADPDGVIAGPAEWGWSGYFFSAKDSVATWMLSPDRRAHGNIPLLPWYLQKLAEHEKRTGVRILDVVDVHFYPQGQGVYGNGARTDPETSALRLRSTRAFWDPIYRDESWINEHVSLIPRLKDWIQKNYPGRGISIGEWSFGAEEHISGGLAIAEALGRFGQQGITSAFYWGKPAPGTPAFHAFRAYRNFDGKGGHFLDWSIPTRDAEGTSIFASRDETSTRFVAVILNLDPTFANDAQIDVESCGQAATSRVFVYGPSSSGLVEQPSAGPGEKTMSVQIPPYALGVVEWTTKHDD
jgi:hypothetical protein